MIRKIGFLLLGETLLVPHIFPIVEAVAARAPDVDVDLWIANAALERLVQPWTADIPSVRLMRVPGFRHDSQPPAKLPTLARLLPSLARTPVVVCAEQTSLWVPRLLPWLPTRFVKTSHGVGSMSARDDPRRMAAHRTLVPSEQERGTYLVRGMPADRIVATGYVKAAFRHRTASRSLFTEDRPVVLYAPHWQQHRSSWPAWGRVVVELLAGQLEWNVILAPHQRLVERAPEVREILDSVSDLPHVHCDLDSFSLVDGSYTSAADVYLGDTSSQVMEFLMRPRPAVFLDPDARSWRSDPSYAMWHAGEVVTDTADILSALSRAPELHPGYRPVQIKLAADALGDTTGVGADRAADEVLRVLAMATGRV